MAVHCVYSSQSSNHLNYNMKLKLICGICTETLVPPKNAFKQDTLCNKLATSDAHMESAHPKYFYHEVQRYLVYPLESPLPLPLSSVCHVVTP